MKIEAYFENIINYIQDHTSHLEIFLCNFYAETTYFSRFNNSRIRQSGQLQQLQITLTLISNQRQCNFTLRLTQDLQQDQQRLASMIKQLRSVLPNIPEDPDLLYATTINHSQQQQPKLNIAPEQAISNILLHCKHLDMVGSFVYGSQYRGFANSFGQKNWHESHNFNFDWSLYISPNQAVKNAYSGNHWDVTLLTQKLASDQQQLAQLKSSAKAIKPGKYRVYLAPSALAEIMYLLSWGGFSAKAHQAKNSPLHRLSAGNEQLHPSICIQEDLSAGFVPRFQAEGFIKPTSIPLITAGQYQQSLIAPRTAAEYQLETNGANLGEHPQSLVIGSGSLTTPEILTALDEGIYISNLWYLNFSNRNRAAITGMTRYACFWVSQGELQQPIPAMRFDDSVYQLLGNELEALTENTTTFLSNNSYNQRAFGCISLPGVLIKSMTITL